MPNLMPTNPDPDLPSWSPNDQVLVKLELYGEVRNTAVVGLLLGLSALGGRSPAFVPVKALGEARLLVPTAFGRPYSAGRLRVMPVFTDAEAVAAWLPARGGHQHPSFGAPADGVELVEAAHLSQWRGMAQAVAVVVNPAGPGVYQLDPEDSALDHEVHSPFWSGAGQDPAGGLCVPPSGSGCGGAARATSARRGQGWGAREEERTVRVLERCPRLIAPDDRAAVREPLAALQSEAIRLAAGGGAREALRRLAQADALAEDLGDYVHRAEMMVLASKLLASLGQMGPALELAHFAVLAASLTGNGPLELAANQALRSVTPPS
jgi:hypothetical protein